MVHPRDPLKRVGRALSLSRTIQAWRTRQLRPVSNNLLARPIRRTRNGFLCESFAIFAVHGLLQMAAEIKIFNRKDCKGRKETRRRKLGHYR
jgi:hypothetical protein